MLDLLDVSVRVPLSAPDHVHHGRARRSWEREAPEEIAFCASPGSRCCDTSRTPRILGDAALDGAAASGCRPVAFDGDLARYVGLGFLHLEP